MEINKSDTTGVTRDLNVIRRHNHVEDCSLDSRQTPTVKDRALKVTAQGTGYQNPSRSIEGRVEGKTLLRKWEPATGWGVIRSRLMLELGANECGRF